MPLHKNPCAGGQEIYNFVRPFLWSSLLSLNGSCTGVQKRIFLKKYINFTLFTPKLPPLEVVGHET